MPPKFKFTEGEKVLCYHGPVIYEAKCVKISFKEKQNKYFIHYQGWNKNWDEWVPEDRVLKYNDANVLKQKETWKVQHETNAVAKKKGANTTKAPGRRSDGTKEKQSNSRASTPLSFAEKPPSRASKSLGGSGTPTSSHDSLIETPRKKRGRVSPEIKLEEFPVKTNFEIPIPDLLKFHLIDEQEVILKQKKLPSLPMTKTVDKIIEDYSKAVEEVKEEKDGLDIEVAKEIAKGIREYFDAAINLKLLYNWEKPQFKEIFTEDYDMQDAKILPSSMYGAFHLLRLFVNLKTLLSYIMWEESNIKLLLKYFQHFLQYLQTNEATLFDLQDYKDPPQDYHRKFPK